MGQCTIKHWEATQKDILVSSAEATYAISEAKGVKYLGPYFSEDLGIVAWVDAYATIGRQTPEWPRQGSSH